MEDTDIDELEEKIKNLKKNKKELRKWQTESKKYFLKHNNAIFEVATGSGKTLIAVDIIKSIIKKHPDIKILVVVPKNVILETGWYKELIDQGLKIQDVGVFYGKIKEITKITLTNMQSITKLPLEIFDMLIVDEVHNFASERLLEVLEHKFKYKLGLTATLKRLDDKHYDLMKIFDYNVFKYDLKQALDDDILNPFIFTSISVNLDDKTKIEYDRVTHQISSLMKIHGGHKQIMMLKTPTKPKYLAMLNARKQLVNNFYKKFIVAKKIINKYKHKKIIVFNQYNSQTSKLYWHLLDLGINCRIIHSGISDAVREKNLMDYKNDKYNILLASKVLDEGYNLPKIDLAIIMAGESSQKQTIQRMGRTLRKKEDSVSRIYQIYCEDTIESANADSRKKFLQLMAQEYKELKCL